MKDLPHNYSSHTMQPVNSTHPRAIAGLDSSVQQTLRNTFLTVTGMLGVTTVTAFLMRDLQLGLLGAVITLVLSIGLIFLINMHKDRGLGLVWLALFSAVFGAMTGSVIQSYLGLPGGGAMVAQAAGFTAVAVGACTAYAMFSGRDFHNLGAFLFAGLIVVILAGIAGIFIKSPIFHLVVSSVSALLFVAYILYDVSEVVKGYQRNYILAATSIYLDVMNLFMSLLRILGILGSDD